VKVRGEEGVLSGTPFLIFAGGLLAKIFGDHGPEITS
jgi:hypothetical protein